MITNRNIVIKREGNKFLLPTVERKEIETLNSASTSSYFMCRIVSYDQASETLCVKITRDIVGEHHFQISTEVNSKILSSLEINSLTFIDSPLPYRLVSNSPIVSYSNTKPYQHTILKEELPRSPKKEEFGKELPKQKQHFKYEAALSVNEIKFLDGKVSFDYFIIPVSRKITFDISNSFLKKEFDSIKNYFPKVLKINKFPVTIEFDFEDGKILNNTCASQHISLINDSLFELVTDLYISDHFINAGQEEIFSLNEVALKLSKTLPSETIKDEAWLLNKLIDQNKTKHYYHLRYLSDKHCSNAFNLRLTSKPLSFIFLLEIPNGFCLIWETYSTEEATYIWKLDNFSLKQLDQPVQELVDRIKWLRGNNKTAYIRSKPEKFKRIEHDYSGDDFGFKKWKVKLEEFILNSHGK